MKSVGEFWFRVGIGIALLFVGLLFALVGPAGSGLPFFLFGLGQLAWTVISANLTIRKARKIEERR